MSDPAPTISLLQFRELWVHAGTACNLSCPFCHEGSKPGDDRIAAPTLAQLAPHLQAAAARGVERFAFTGGEPLIQKGMVEILLFALQLRPAMVLTNGTAPLIRRSHQLALLRQTPYPLAFRVSIDHADESRHDAGRGLKTFRKALEGLSLLHAAGFTVSVTRQVTPGEDAARVAEQYRRMLRKHQLPADLHVDALPELGALGTPATHGVSDDSSWSSARPPCSRSRVLLMRRGLPRFHACPLTDDAPGFDCGDSLEDALAAPVVANHPRCTLCLGCGVDYAGSPVDLR